MKILDSHTHTNHSYDGHVEPIDMIKAAIAKGVKYLALTDHEDLYMGYCPMWKKIKAGYGTIPNKEKHFEEILRLKEEFSGEIDLAIGVEFGYIEEAVPDYERISKLPFDVIINSVHSAGHKDIYYPEFYEGRDKNAAYTEYLTEILKSANATYDWDILGHIGYISRKSPYADPILRYSEFHDLLDGILKAIAEKGKALEVNSHTHNIGEYIPELPILKRFRELGGEIVTFGSDAHTAERIGEKYGACTAAAKAAGFEYIAYYKGRKAGFERI